LESTQDELVQLIRERERIEWRINKLQKDIVHLAALCRIEIEDPISQLGLTDAVRWVIAENTYQRSGVLVGALSPQAPKSPATLAQIIEVLKSEYPESSQYRNLTANVQTILKRLIKAKEVRLDEKSLLDKNLLYVWCGGPPPLPPPPNWLKERLKGG
jgi:hypothetical protein